MPGTEKERREEIERVQELLDQNARMEVELRARDDCPKVGAGPPLGAV